MFIALWGHLTVNEVDGLRNETFLCLAVLVLSSTKQQQFNECEGSRLQSDFASWSERLICISNVTLFPWSFPLVSVFSVTVCRVCRCRHWLCGSWAGLIPCSCSHRAMAPASACGAHERYMLVSCGVQPLHRRTGQLCGKDRGMLGKAGCSIKHGSRAQERKGSRK